MCLTGNSRSSFKSKKINWAFSFEEDFFFKGSNLASPADAKLAHMFAIYSICTCRSKVWSSTFSPTSVLFTFMLWIKLEQFLTYVIANFSTMV